MNPRKQLILLVTILLCTLLENALAIYASTLSQDNSKLLQCHKIKVIWYTVSYLILSRSHIFQEKPAFIFCVEDRALFCRDCDEPIHIAGSLSGNHQRLLATGISIALSSSCNKKDAVKVKNSIESSSINSLEAPPRDPAPSKAPAVQQVPSAFSPSSAWTVEEFLQLSDYESTDKKGSPFGFGELDWFADIGLFPNDQVPNIDSPTAGEVPQMPKPQANNAAFYRPSKSSMVSKRQRVEGLDDFFAVPDLG